MSKGITRGDWKLGEVETEIKVGDRLVAGTGGFTANYEPTREENEANAEFICLCANQCQLVNPDHPEYVAEKIGEMYEALKAVANVRPDLLVQIYKVLAEIERKK